MHHIDRATPWEEIWQAMETLVAQGKVIYVGCRNFAGWHIAQANETARRRHFLGLVSEQSLYNLIDRTVELEVLPACKAYGARRHPVEPARRRPARRRPRRRRRTAGARATAADGGSSSSATQLEAYEKLCAELGEPPGRRRARVAAREPGRHRADHRPAHDGAARRRAAQRSTSSSTRRCSNELDEIFPGPGGAAPEAYAW